MLEDGWTHSCITPTHSVERIIDVLVVSHECMYDEYMTVSNCEESLEHIATGKRQECIIEINESEER